jgi:phage shock protein E
LPHHLTATQQHPVRCHDGRFGLQRLAKEKNETIKKMIDVLKSMFGIGPAVDYHELMAKGAQIIDVRTPGEYAGGHISGSKNIPLQTLGNNLGKINKAKPVITCCASGMRSASAKSVLENNGFTEVYNGGGWGSLKAKLK